MRTPVLHNFKNSFLLYLTGGIFLLALLQPGCRKDQLIRAPGAKLDIPTDTLTFDTVFTKRGSATRYFKVFNPHDKRIKIRKISLGGGQNSPFRLNINGNPVNNEDTNYVIRPHDSLYIFAEVTVTPTKQNNPFLIYDSVNFYVNKSRQAVTLTAWGQNAHYYSDANLDCQSFTIQTQFGPEEFVLCDLPCDITWEADKPYVIAHNVVVDSGCYLRIKQGANIHVSKNARLFVSGTLQSGDLSGSIDNPVTFQGDRLESFYTDKPGQWDGIHLLQTSKNNLIINTVIKNAVAGVRVDSLSVNPPNTKLYIRNTIIKNTLSSGIIGLTGAIIGENCLIYNCGKHNIELRLGGSYRFTHCTFSNYSSDWLDHKDPILSAQNYLKTNTLFLGPLYAEFVNSIIYGGQKEELGLDKRSGTLYDVIFDHCLIRTKEKDTAKADYKSILLNQKPKFENKDFGEEDFHLKKSSPALEKGKNTSLDEDLEGNSRDDTPDLGAYEQ